MHVLVLHLLAAWSSPSSDLNEQRGRAGAKEAGGAGVAFRLKVYVPL